MGIFKELLKAVDTWVTEINYTRDQSTLHAQKSNGSAGNDLLRLIEKEKFERPYWEKNWRRNGEDFVGVYVTPHGSWHGYIRKEYEGVHKFYIVKPPVALKEHHHWNCFKKKGKDLYEAHFKKVPKDISTGIIEIERLIREAF